MITLEQVSRRVLTDQSWVLKTVIGAVLLVMAPFCLLLTLPLPAGYIYRVADLGRRGLTIELPDWEGWRGMFVDGIRFLAIIGALAVLPLGVTWIMTMTLTWLLQAFPGYLAFAWLLYLPMVPVLLFVFPLSAASVYRFQRRGEFRDAFRMEFLFRMVVATKGRLVVPALALIGLVIVLLPIFPYALFAGGLVFFYYCALVFHGIEAAARARASAQTVLRR
jgi:hypothetical protein